MKISVCGDIHLCKNSSIVRQRGTHFSARLENCIKSLNWFEEISKEYGCESEVFLGDVFDSASLDDETITAINMINWNDLPKQAIVGNHESSTADLAYSSLNILARAANFNIISTPTSNIYNDIEFCYLPYIIESDRKLLSEYFEPAKAKRIIFSHNDIKGIQFGPITSKTGFTIEDIEANSDLFINGHLHNGQQVTPKIINLGVLTGKDLGENAAIFPHNILILDTDTLKYELVENPFAFNFYKLEILEKADLNKIKELKDNAVVSAKCAVNLLSELKDILDAASNVYTYRIIAVQTTADSDITLDSADLFSDHLAKFIECCKEKLENTEILEQELAEICK